VHTTGACPQRYAGAVVGSTVYQGLRTRKDNLNDV
jgi:hypothetical protein